MLIDWFTVGAQILNFLILVWLLKRYLYKPILGAIDKRETIISSQLQEAEKIKAASERERTLFQQKNDEIERNRSALLAAVAAEAEAERKKMIADARTECDVLRSNEKTFLKNRNQELWHDVRTRAQSEVFAIVRKTLADLASDTLEQRITAVFVNRLRGLSPDDKRRLSSSQPAFLRSAFALTTEQQNTLVAALRETLNGDLNIHFEAASSLISGIELISNGNKLAWSISDYLESLQKNVTGLLEGESSDESTPEQRGAAHES